jgi:thiamine kinase-like enzyme
MLEQAAYEMGRFQGKIFKNPHHALANNINGLGDIGALRRGYEQGDRRDYYSILREDDCDLPPHLKQMLIDIDNDLETIFNELRLLPVVLCHGDFFLENIFFSEKDGIRLIDWDCAGWGDLGEDIAYLISVQIDFKNFKEYCKRLIPAYYKGISEYMAAPENAADCLKKFIIIKLGYRFVRWYMTSEHKKKILHALQEIYEM